MLPPSFPLGRKKTTVGFRAQKSLLLSPRNPTGESGLLFNLHVCTCVRGVRRLAGKRRVGESDADLHVRRERELLSVGSILLQKRLEHLGRVVRRGPPERVALAASHPQGRLLRCDAKHGCKVPSGIMETKNLIKR